MAFFLVRHQESRLAVCFVDLVDPLVPRGCRHDLVDLVTITVCAVLRGADTFVDIAAWGQAKRYSLRSCPIVFPTKYHAAEEFGVDPVV